MRTHDLFNHGMCAMTNNRHYCPQYLKSDILCHQNYRCLYCSLKFGSVVTRSLHKSVLTVVHWDHFVPFSYLCYSPGDNWVASCNVCNAYKHALVYETLDAAQLDIMDRWARDGRRCAWDPPISSECDGNKWSIYFASWLSLRSTEWEDDTLHKEVVDTDLKAVLLNQNGWTVARIASELGLSSVKVTRLWLRNNDIAPIGTQPATRPGQRRNLYDRDAVLAARSKQRHKISRIGGRLAQAGGG